MSYTEVFEMKRIACLVLALCLLFLLCATSVGSGGAVQPRGGGPGSERFDTWILLQNPGGETANATVEFMTEAGEEIEARRTVAPHSRDTVFANDYVDGAGFSTTVTSDMEIIAERSEYFDYRGRIDGGHAKPGIARTSRQWYFAEGYAGS